MSSPRSMSFTTTQSNLHVALSNVVSPLIMDRNFDEQDEELSDISDRMTPEKQIKEAYMAMEKCHLDSHVERCESCTQTSIDDVFETYYYSPIPTPHGIALTPIPVGSMDGSNNNLENACVMITSPKSHPNQQELGSPTFFSASLANSQQPQTIPQFIPCPIDASQPMYQEVDWSNNTFNTIYNQGYEQAKIDMYSQIYQSVMQQTYEQAYTHAFSSAMEQVITPRVTLQIPNLQPDDKYIVLSSLQPKKFKLSSNMTKDDLVKFTRRLQKLL